MPSSDSAVRIVDINSDAIPPAVLALIRRRRMAPSAYRFEPNSILQNFQGLVARCGLNLRQTINLVTICSLDRSNAALLGKSSSTIIFDLGFLEILSDYVIVTRGLHEDIALNPADQIYWEDAKLQLSGNECQQLQREVREKLGHVWDFDAVVETDLNETTGTGGLEEEAISLTGSQMFRDAASRLMETGFGKEYRQDIFEAFCLWPHRVGDAEFRPGPLIANQLHLSPNVDGAIRGRYQTLIEMGALQVLAHELSHCLFPSRDTLVAWHGSDEMVAIRSDLADRCAAQRTAHNGWSDPDFEDLLKPECEQSPRTRRAISEAFFDLRALEMIILAEGEYADPDFEEVFLGTLVRLTSNNIAIMIMRDAMTEAMHSRKAMYETMIQAIHETLQRCYVIHTALAARFRSRYPGFNTFRLEKMLNENRESIKLFASFYMADLCNNLPSLAFEGEDWQEYEERAWTEFMSVVKSSALP